MNLIRTIYALIAIIVFQTFIMLLVNIGLNYHSEICMYETNKTMANLLLLFSFVLITTTMVSLVCIFYAFKNIDKEVEKQIRVDNLEYMKRLLHIILGHRQQNNHHLQTIYGLLSINDYENARKYLEESTADICNINEVSLSNASLNSLLDVKRRKMERHGIKFKLNIKTDVIIPCKSSDFNILVGNLLDNAIEKLISIPLTEPIIQLEIYRHGELFILKVSDNGPPISQLYKDKLFIPGFSTKEEGDGLGLSSVNEVLKKYNGEIIVQSEEGITCFLISIPLKK